MTRLSVASYDGHHFVKTRYLVANGFASDGIRCFGNVAAGLVEEKLHLQDHLIVLYIPSVTNSHNITTIGPVS